MWNIYGKKYDLTNFANLHPGGADIIERTKGLDDCTPLVERYHSFSRLNHIKKALEKYLLVYEDKITSSE
jgi:cytochrome b involved in lipid metabolism